MKNSIYNLLIPANAENDILYNSFSNTFFVVSNKIRQSLKTPSVVKESWRNLYRELVKNGFYVEERINEFERLRQLTYDIAMKSDTYLLIINPTLDCNLKCWYCYENHVRKSIMTDDIQNRVRLFIDKIVSSDIKSFTLSFFGGEPLLRFNHVVLPLIKYAHLKCKENNIAFDTSFTSNGTLLTSNIIHELTSFGPTSFQITIDGNEETHNNVRFFRNGKGTYQLIMKNIQLLLSYKCHVTLRINYTSQSIRTVYDVIEEISHIDQLSKAFLTVDFHRVWQDKENMDVLPEVKEMVDMLYKQNVKATYSRLNEIKSPCYGDRLNTAVINYNGDVFKCTAKDFSTQNREGYIDEHGVIIWEKSQQDRICSKLKNKACQDCCVAPLCGSGCTRYILEHLTEEGSYCLLGFDEHEKKKIVINQIETIIRNNEIPSLHTI